MLDQSNYAFAQASKVSQLEFDSIIFSIKEIDARITKNRKKDSVYTSQLMQQVDSLRNEIAKENEKVLGIEGLITKSSNTATTGAIFILIGLLLELVGAAFVSGNIFMEKVEKIFEDNLNFIFVDLALTNPEREKTYKFIGTFGALLLVIGFVFQFAGTALILNMSLAFKSTFIALSIFSSFWLIWYLSGKTADQSRKEKFKFLIFDLYTFFLKRQTEKVLSYRKKVLCDICLKPVKVDETEISWIWEENSMKHPYLYVPHYFKCGHKYCLSKFKIFTTVRRDSNVKVCKSSIQYFVQNEFPRIEN